MRHDRTADARYVSRYAKKLETLLGLSTETDSEPAFPGQPSGPSKSFLLVRNYLKTLPDDSASRILGRLIIAAGGSLMEGEDWLTDTYIPNRSRMEVFTGRSGCLQHRAPGYSIMLDLAACSILCARNDLATARKIRSFGGADFSDAWYHIVAREWDVLARWKGVENRLEFLIDLFPQRSRPSLEKLARYAFDMLPAKLRRSERRELIDALKALPKD